MLLSASEVLRWGVYTRTSYATLTEFIVDDAVAMHECGICPPPGHLPSLYMNVTLPNSQAVTSNESCWHCPHAEQSVGYIGLTVGRSAVCPIDTAAAAGSLLSAPRVGDIDR